MTSDLDRALEILRGGGVFAAAPDSMDVWKRGHFLPFLHEVERVAVHMRHPERAIADHQNRVGILQGSFRGCAARNQGRADAELFGQDDAGQDDFRGGRWIDSQG